MKRNKFRVITLFTDIVILAISFIIMVLLKPAGLSSYVPSHGAFFILLAVIWLTVSIVNGKMHRGKITNFTSLFNKVIGSNLISVSLLALIMYIIRDYSYSRGVVLGTIIIATLSELFIGAAYIAYKKANVRDYEEADKFRKYRKPSEEELVNKINGNGNGNAADNAFRNENGNTGGYNDRSSGGNGNGNAGGFSYNDRSSGGNGNGNGYNNPGGTDKTGSYCLETAGTGRNVIACGHGIGNHNESAGIKGNGNGNDNGNGNWNTRASGNGNGTNHENYLNVNPGIIQKIEKEAGTEMAGAIIGMTGPNLNGRTAVLSTTTVFNVENLPKEKYTYLINLHKINDITQLDGFIDAVNDKIEMNGYFFCCVETKDQRKKRILKKYPPGLNYIYYSLDFILKRIFPKLKFTRPLYMFLTNGGNSVISRAEALGRLCRGGFHIMQESFIGNLLCIEAKKIRNPLPVNGYSYGPIIALPRIGKDGKQIKVYKLRTMHPYSEYIQDYVYKMHDLQEGGKFRDDFRITTWGAFCRRVWLDELPMLINMFKGNMKLVGVRPLSKQYFNLYDEGVKEKRMKHKPGLVPPYYADMPASLEEIQASEMRYLDEFEKQPVKTDIRYFFKSWWNIFFHEARSN